MPSTGTLRRLEMDAGQIRIGDQVTKGHKDYTVVTKPREGIFQATDDSGQTVALATHEVLRVPATRAAHD